MEIIEILHPLGPVQVNHVSEWKQSGPFMAALNCSVHPGGVVNIILYPSDGIFGADSKQQLAIVKTKNSTIAVSKAVLDAADKTAVKDKAYTGGAQPTAPAQQAADKPKDYPWATETLPAGEHHKKILILDIKPAINKDGVRMTNEYQGKVAYKFNVTFALDGVKRTAIIDSSSEIDPMIPQSGEVDIIIKVTPAQREGGKPFYALKKPKSGGGFGGGSAPADPALALLAGIVSNPNIKIADWESALLTAISALNSAKKSMGGSK